MSSEKGQKHIYAQEHQLYYYYNNFRGHSENESKTVQISWTLPALGRRLFYSYFILQKYSFSPWQALNFDRTPQNLSKEYLLQSFQRKNNRIL